VKSFCYHKQRARSCITLCSQVVWVYVHPCNINNLWDRIIAQIKNAAGQLKLTAAAGSLCVRELYPLLDSSDQSALAYCDQERCQFTLLRRKVDISQDFYSLSRVCHLDWYGARSYTVMKFYG